MGQRSSKSTHRSNIERESERVLFLWLYRHRRFPFKLSKNVLREICMYLSLPQFLVMITKNKVLNFSTRRREWSEESHLSEPLPRYCSGHSIVCLRDSSIFVCGAGATAHLIRRGEVTKLQFMRIGRYFHSAIQPTQTNRVYAFGGGNSSDPKPFLSEFFDFVTGQWAKFASLIRPRSRINACEYQRCVYFVGGDTYGTVELYSLAKGEFALLDDLRLPLPHLNCVSVIEDGVCLCISLGTSLQWKLCNKKIAWTVNNEVEEIDTASQPRVAGNVLYAVGGRSCVLVSMSDGKMIANYEVSDELGNE